MKEIILRVGAAVLVLGLVLAALCLCEERLAPTFAEGGGQMTVVLDAGHGGFDGGAVGVSGVTEQDINLSVSQRTCALLGLFGVPVRMTREGQEALNYDPSRTIRENKIADIYERRRIVEETNDPLFLSIHLNKFSDPQYHGAQVFYSVQHAASKALAEGLQEVLIQGADKDNNRKAKPAADTIYLMKKLTCPAVIVECGFLSNPDEEARLTSENYQKTLALCITDGVLRFFHAECAA